MAFIVLVFLLGTSSLAISPSSFFCCRGHSSTRFNSNRYYILNDDHFTWKASHSSTPWPCRKCLFSMHNLCKIWIIRKKKRIYRKSRICIVERIQISYFLALSHVAMFYATTEQKLIHSFWNVLRIRRKINQLVNYTKICVIHRLYTTLHKTILGFADIHVHVGSMEKFFWFFLYHPSYMYNKKKVQ